MTFIEFLPLIQVLLAVAGCGMIARVLRWQVGFCTLDSVEVGWRADFYFTGGVVLVAQYFFVPCAELFN